MDMVKYFSLDMSTNTVSTSSESTSKNLEEDYIIRMEKFYHLKKIYYAKDKQKRLRKLFKKKMEDRKENKENKKSERPSKKQKKDKESKQLTDEVKYKRDFTLEDSDIELEDLIANVRREEEE